MSPEANEQFIKYIEYVESSFKSLTTIIQLLEKKVEFLENSFITHLEDHRSGDHSKWQL